MQENKKYFVSYIQYLFIHSLITAINAHNIECLSGFEGQAPDLYYLRIA